MSAYKKYDEEFKKVSSPSIKVAKHKLRCVRNTLLLVYAKSYMSIEAPIIKLSISHPLHEQ